ncbi:MAG: DNA-3-methyladenine glycosylase [Acidimicrobiia bacterium]
MADLEILSRESLARPALEIAPFLLGKVFVVGERAGRIVEVEAYAGRHDPGSHAYRGMTPRTEVMFGSAGHLYVYFTYGMHFCANVVGGEVGEAQAVLLRALAPMQGLPEMRAARPKAKRDIDLCNGPAKLCQALGIDRAFNGADVVGGDQRLFLADDGFVLRDPPMVSTRIGLSAGADLPWRFYIETDPHVSRR